MQARLLHRVRVAEPQSAQDQGAAAEHAMRYGAPGDRGAADAWRRSAAASQHRRPGRASRGPAGLRRRTPATPGREQRRRHAQRQEPGRLALHPEPSNLGPNYCTPWFIDTWFSRYWVYACRWQVRPQAGAQLGIFPNYDYWEFWYYNAADRQAHFWLAYEDGAAPEW